MNTNADKSLILWSTLQKGNVQALGDLYDFYIDDLFTYGIQISVDKELVMDCIHDLFLSLYKYRENLANTTNVKYYLLYSLKTTIIRKQKLQARFPSEISEFEKSEDNTIEESLIATDFENERNYKLSKALTSLSKKQRKCLKLRFTENQSYDDIATTLHISVNSARTLVYRAIKALRAHINMLIILFL